ncbi:type VI secretion system tube protein TssD [Draconibacterium sp. IB214405]|uniref:type VI secretion system tube protein TssD n=1 Tax=Draconibacterium sp. IB214405 TaxID=3097352 RepID=UPI002A0F7523|nr:type VI secretion system tube protein TssD [Draconibacterium sp. IB214405]MDX8340110.1 type VI secretion system tube protein TssD [Draconibacterium sp. IB214405]
MSLSARLHISGHRKEQKGIRVIESDFEFAQDVDTTTGQICGRMKGGKINILLDIENDGELLHWMFHNVVKNGKIIFIGLPEGKSIKTIEFENAYLIYYKEVFKEVTSVNIRITISAQKMTIAGEQMENSWTGFRNV